ncbi:hypothetical protein AC578_7831 [Pseudocercospora eumusae]|uniref:Uncharacterized protein n=1 Tax=Pseudocercospora eumusae TaxID=321146 RepID=A0A139HIX5_9PEZI|nr:hypothetical protein AC578_7831 [Pseudocercospora eumusae]
MQYDTDWTHDRGYIYTDSPYSQSTEGNSSKATANAKDAGPSAIYALTSGMSASPGQTSYPKVSFMLTNRV